MNKPYCQYALIVVAGYLLTGLPVSVLSACPVCHPDRSLLPAPSALTQNAVAAQGRTCCGLARHPGPVQSAQPQELAPATPDDQAPQRCTHAGCCTAAPKLLTPPATLSPLLLTGTQHATPPTFTVALSLPLDPPPPRG
ncbi:MAG: hypothetical protein AAF797_11885 [Planctomycetota bacterium]